MKSGLGWGATVVRAEARKEDAAERMGSRVVFALELVAARGRAGAARTRSRGASCRPRVGSARAAGPGPRGSPGAGEVGHRLDAIGVGRGDEGLVAVADVSPGLGLVREGGG